MRINHNITALNTYRQLSTNTDNQSKSIEKLSSGLRINRASDDAAGLAISEKMRGQIRGLDQASRNAQDSISLIQTAEGALNETHDILQRMRELAVQSSNSTETDTDRQSIQQEVGQLKSEIDRIAGTTQFNSKNLLDGSLSATKNAQGTVANSALINVADTAATSGTNKAGLAMALNTATTGQTGTGASVTGGATLANTTIIQTGTNDKFNITINGNTYNATISAGSYSQSNFVSALNTAVQSAVNTAGNNWANQDNQAVFSLNSSGKLQLTTAAAGTGTSISVAVPGTPAESALSAMGMAGNVTAVTGTVNLTNGYTTAATGQNKIDVTIGATTKTIDLEAAASGLTAATNYTFAQLKTALQAGLDNQFGTGATTVGDDGQGHITLTSNVGTGTLKIADTSGAGTTASVGLGIATAGASTTNVSNLAQNGTNTVNATAAGTVISSGVNDQFNISVDGGATQSITLKAGNYATQSALVNEINNELNGNSNLVGKATASVDNNGKITFSSTSTGSSSSVKVSDPATVAQSALGAIGYEGSAGNITAAAAANIHGGVDLTGSKTQLSVTLGNKSATLDISSYAGILGTAGTATNKMTSRDAIVNALQSEFDKNFGKGAVTVNTQVDPTGAIENLTFSTNTQASAFKVTGGSGATALLGGTATAAVSASGNNSQANGTDAIHNTFSNSTLLTQLSDTSGNNLGLSAGNVINISGTQNGSGFSTALTVNANSSMGDIVASLRNLSQFQGSTVSLDTTNNKIVVTGANGQTHDISNLKFAAQKSATDTTAVAGFNNEFSTFTVTQQAQDAHTDGSLSMAIGANQGQTMNVDVNDMSTKGLRLQNVDVSTASGAQTAISVLDNAIQSVSAERSKLGAYQNRLEHTINNLNTSNENLTSAESRIRDVDMAKEMMNQSKNSILAQASQAMLAQANQQPQGVLQLLR